MSRDNTVRVSDEELSKLKNYRDSKFSGYVPLGFVIGSAIDEASKD